MLSPALSVLKIGEVDNMGIASSIPPVVDVVTGTDWPAVWAAIATGLAALVGIGGTAYLARRASNDAKANLATASADAKANRDAASTDLQASLKAAADQLATSINAEDRRAHTAEKRRVYASVVSAMNETMIAAIGYRVARMGNDDEERKTVLTRQTQAQEGMFRAMGEMFLTASYQVAGNAVALQNTLIEFMKASHAGQPFTGPEPRAVRGVLDALVRSIRQDLREPVGTAEDQGPGERPENA
jgi:hypothetical protein